ncbi:MAG: hypothetical protein V9G19_04690 [Tetrasphaera sp.]
MRDGERAGQDAEARDVTGRDTTGSGTKDSDTKDSDTEAHDIKVTYEEEVVDLPDDLAVKWDSWRVTEGPVVDYYAKGPCPGCGADAQGVGKDRLAPIERQGNPALVPEKAARKSAIEVAVSCRCGYAHGQDGATGCGRRWSVLVDRTN